MLHSKFLSKLTLHLREQLMILELSIKDNHFSPSVAAINYLELCPSTICIIKRIYFYTSHTTIMISNIVFFPTMI